MKKIVLAMIFCVCMILMWLMPVRAMADSNTFDISQGNITIAADSGSSVKVTYGASQATTTAQAITIIGTTTTNHVIVETGVTANITLSNVSIDVSAITNACSFDIQGSSAVNLNLVGTNTLKSNGQAAGLQVQSKGGNTAAVTIDGAGTLNSSSYSEVENDVNYTGGAGIGGSNGGAGGNITINGGVINASSYDGGAGIGGGYQSAGGTITINGGTITATAGSSGAGIGGGNAGRGGTININGGTVTANGSYYGAGIGGGLACDGGTININGGTVTAAGEYLSAGIGGGEYGDGGTININGGTVTVTGGNGGAGIGGGMYGGGGTIYISGGNVKASSVASPIKVSASDSRDVSLTTVTLSNVSSITDIASMAGVGSYGLNGVRTLDTNKLYLYLPSGVTVTEAVAGGITYTGSVTAGDTGYLTSEDPDIAAVNSAKAAAEGVLYSNMTQGRAASEDVIKDALKAAAASAINNSSVEVTINQVSYNLPIAGTAANQSGTDGSYTFTITVKKGLQTQTTVQKMITITAKPYQVVSTYEVSGTVIDDTPSKVPVPGADVKLMAGDTQVGASAVTAINGAFTIDYVPNGTYNLVVTKYDRTVTAIVIVNNGNGILSSAIILPSVKTNSLVEVTGGDTPKVVVGNLDGQFSSTAADNDKGITTSDNSVVAGGGSVEVKLKAEKKDGTAVNAGSISATAVSNGTTVGIFIDLSVVKTVTPSGGSATVTPLVELPSLIDVYIPLPAELRGKTSYEVYRYHGTGVDTITTTANIDGEKIALVDNGTAINLTIKKFSTYAIAYTASSGGTGGGSSSGSNRDHDKDNRSHADYYTITVKENNGGTISPSTTSVPWYSDKTFTIIPDTGYEIINVMVDGVNVGAVREYTFSRVAGVHTIEAAFVKGAVDVGAANTVLDKKADQMVVSVPAKDEKKSIELKNSTVSFNNSLNKSAEVSKKKAKTKKKSTSKIKTKTKVKAKVKVKKSKPVKKNSISYKKKSK